jgi:TrwC relaxase
VLCGGPGLGSVQGPDGRWTALDGRDLYRHRLAADAIYRATYQRELVRTLRVEWTAADTHGNRELAGMPEELIRSFSKRADQIELEVERLEAEGRERTPRLVKWAVQATRKAKQHDAADTLYGRWRNEATERGVDADTLVQAVTGRTLDRGQDQTLSDVVAGRLFDRLAGSEGMTATASTFTRPDVLVALVAGLVGVGRTELEALVDRFLAERAVSVVADRTLEERRWSTPTCWRSSSGWSRAPPAGSGSRRPGSPTRRFVRPWRRTRPPAQTRPGWSGMCARAAPASAW